MIDKSMIMFWLNDIDRVTPEVQEIFLENFDGSQSPEKAVVNSYVRASWSFLQTLQFDQAIFCLEYVQWAMKDDQKDSYNYFTPKDRGQLR